VLKTIILPLLRGVNTLCLCVVCVSLRQGAPESVIERCQYLRVGTGKVLLTAGLRDQLLSKIREWGSGRDTLRCLALATRDQPPRPADMDLVNSVKFAEYEVGSETVAITLSLQPAQGGNVVALFHLAFCVKATDTERVN